jgi:predicted nucleic acid-binding protein
LTYFFDSIALVKLYHNERGSPQIGAIFDEPDRRIIISRLVGVEFHSALALKTRTGKLGPMEAAGLRLRFFDHVTSGAILLVSVREHHYVDAERLIVLYGDRKGLRTLDALQLAVVLEAQARLGLDAFVVSDTALAEIARTEGLLVLNPEA